MALAAAAAFEDLGPLVLGDHALDLEQELFLGRAPRRVVEEDELEPATVQPVDEQDLVGIPAGQPVGRVSPGEPARPADSGGDDSPGGRIAAPLSWSLTDSPVCRS